MLSNMKLGTKLLLAFLAVGIIPFAVIAISALTKSSNALSHQAFNQLEGVRGIKKGQIEQFFAEREGDMGVLMETVATLKEEAFYTLEAIQVNKKIALEGLIHQWFVDVKAQQGRSICTKAMKHYEAFLETGEKSAEYNRFAAIIDGFIKVTGYYDFFVINNDGVVVHSQAQESDYKTNLVSGPFSDSGLARAFQKAQKGQVAFVDFSPYAPSNNEPAAFLAAPILSAGEQTGVVVLQISMEKTQKIMSNRTGMGKTGEAYLVGPDKLMRSDSFLDPVNHSVKGSFANPGKGRVDTEAAREALAGRSGHDVIVDYNGNPVLSSYAPLQVADTTWAIIAEIDVAEAFSPVGSDGKEYYAKYIEKYGYYDLFLMNPDGYCFYTVTKEADYQSNFVNGKYADSNLGDLFKQVMQSMKFGLADFAPYAPSNGEPAAFIAQPVLHNGDVELVVALQLSLDAINKVMQQRDGMGETGETYLVGADKLMRSDSYLDPTNHSVQASFANPAIGKVDTDAAEAALSGKTGTEIIIDYNGNPVLSAYTPIKIGETTWALIAEIDEAEAFAAVKTLEWLIGVITVVCIAVIIAIALLITRSISKPISKVVTGLGEGAEQVAAASGSCCLNSSIQGQQICLEGDFINGFNDF